MKKLFSQIVFLLLISIAISYDDYNLVLHSHDRGAACLDGSPAGMYIQQGNGKNKDKFLIYFNGGGFCGAPTLQETIQSCYQRSFTSLGTTTKYEKTRSFEGKGQLSPNPDENPTFHDWTKIFAIYCDGSEHQGYRQNPISYKGQNLYFRGTRNSLEQFYYLDKNYDFYNKEAIVITGISAGGMATFQWTQYLYEHTKTSKVFAIPDSGLFLTDFYSPIVKEKVIRVEATNLLELVGVDENQFPKPIKQCLDEMKDLVACYDASNYAKYIQAPILLIQSTYDQWTLKYLLIVDCLTNSHTPFSIASCNETTRNTIEDYRHALIQAIYKIKRDRKDVGIWGPACVQHGFSASASFASEKYEVPTTTGKKIYQVIQKFLENPNNAPWFLDEGEWPSNNTGCNGLETFNLLTE